MRKNLKKIFLLITFCMLTLTLVFSNSVEVHAALAVDTLVSSGLKNPFGVAVDSFGNVYIADTGNNAIKKCDPLGNVTTLVSSGLNDPCGVAVDSSGNVYIADSGNHAIKKRDTSGNVTTLASSGLNAKPYGVAVDSSGSVYFAECYNGIGVWITNDGIMKWDSSTHQVSTLVPPEYLACGVAVDSSRNVYFTGGINEEIMKCDPSGSITTLASSGLYCPNGVAVDSSGNVYIADSGNNAIKKCDPSGNVSTFVSGLNNPLGVAVDSSGNVYISDTLNNKIKKCNPSATVSVAPYNAAVIPGNASAAVTWRAPYNNGGSLITDYKIDVYSNGSLIKTVDTNSTVTVATVLGLSNGTAYTFDVLAVNGVGNSIASNATSSVTPVAPPYTVTRDPSGNGITITTLVSGLSNPVGVAVDSSGNVYIDEQGNNAIRKCDPSGIITTLVVSVPGFPMGAAVDSSGNVYIANFYGSAINKIDTSGNVTILVSSSRVTNPSAVAVDRSGNVYIVDTGNNVIKKCDPSGTVTTFVSSGLTYATGVAVDSSGNVYIIDSDRTGKISAIKKYDSSGHLTTLVASGLSYVSGIAVDSSGNVYISDFKNKDIKKYDPSGIVTTLVSSGLDSPGLVAVDSSGNVYVVDGNSIKKITVSAPAVPDAPTNAVATTGNASASLNWTAPANNGGSAITNYKIDVYSNGSLVKTVDTNSIAASAIVTGLSNGTAYTFDVVAVNSVGSSPASSVTIAVTPAALATVPDSPTKATATIKNGKATIRFTPPANNGGSPIIRYEITVNPDGYTVSGLGNPIMVTSLKSGVNYTFTIKAINAAGESISVNVGQ